MVSSVSQGERRRASTKWRRFGSALGVLAPTIALSCCGRKCAPSPSADAGANANAGLPPIASSYAPPLEPVPTAETPQEVTTARPVSCPTGMMLVDGAFCIDKWEASLVDKRTGLSLSPYYPPDRHLAVQLEKTWERQRLLVGTESARAIPLPELPGFEREHDVNPVAVSRRGAIPNGYLSGVMAQRACENARKRLCRHDEWVKACKGEKKQRFPYGDEYRQGLCNIFRALHPAQELHGDASQGHLDPRLNLVREENGAPLLRRTGSLESCHSAWGSDTAWDMNGNLDEWVDDEHGRFDGGFFSRSKRDGCESSVAAHPRTYFDYSTGVRCCADVTE